MFLNQMLEDYRGSNNKQEILSEFIEQLWNSKYVYKKYKKYYTYRVDESLLSNDVELIELFNEYNRVEYSVCRSYYKKDLDSIDYIRMRINNMYGFLVDDDVYYDSQYYKLLITPKREYFKAINTIKSGGYVNSEEIKKIIELSIKESEVIKQNNIDKKVEIKLSNYKKLINSYIEKIFNNYIPVHEYEELHGWEMRVNVDGWSEENYIIKYFCKSLTGYLRNYVRDNRIKEVREKQCVVCGKKVINTNNSKKYCENCAKRIKNEQNKKYYHLGK